MSDLSNSAQYKADDLGGKVKDAVGGLTDNSSLQAEGKVDQATANAKQAAGQLGGQAQDAARTAVSEAKAGRGIVHALHAVGIRSEWAYAAGFASIGVALGSWFLSRSKTGDSKGQSDRWGIFIGEWAPTFMVLGVALRAEED